MVDNETFPRPVVKQVAFEVRFPNLFYIESRIGSFQVEVMKDFPRSELLHRRSFMVLAGDLDSAHAQEAVKQQSADAIETIWQFKTDSGTRLEISSKNLVLVSEKHHSYHEGGEKSFRAIIEKTVFRFLDLIQIPIVQRVGLRYINECPLFDKTTKTFKDCYNSILPVDRFGLENLTNADCVVLVTKENSYQLRHIESIRFVPTGDHLLLDFDAWTENVASDQVLVCADSLHEMISSEFKLAIKEPILKFMRGN